MSRPFRKNWRKNLAALAALATIATFAVTLASSCCSQDRESHHEKEFLPEAESAKDVLNVVCSFGSPLDWAARSRDLFVGRWIPRPGWAGVVASAPRLEDGQWTVEIRENGTGAVILACSLETMAHLRPGQPVTVLGQVAGTNACRSVTVRSTTVAIE